MKNTCNNNNNDNTRKRNTKKKRPSKASTWATLPSVPQANQNHPETILQVVKLLLLSLLSSMMMSLSSSSSRMERTAAVTVVPIVVVVVAFMWATSWPITITPNCIINTRSSCIRFSFPSSLFSLSPPLNTSITIETPRSEQQHHQPPQQPEDCQLVMAESSIPNAGWGVFTLQDLPAGSTTLSQLESVFGSSVVIPVIDLQQSHLDSGLSLLFHTYMWSTEITGGYTEGTVVYAALPGIGSLANTDPIAYNVMPYQAQYHPIGTVLQNDGSTSTSSPGAGASSYYQNFSFVPSKPIPAGGEILLDYGRGWDAKVVSTTTKEQVPIHRRRSTLWLRKHGMCLDHLQPGPSTIPHAGQGAFAKRFLSAGTVLAPAPLIPIANRQSLQFVASFDRQNTRQQLLMNYCWGHPNSSLLLFPYAPMIALINHSRQRPNAKIRWSARRQQDQQQPQLLSLEQVRSKAGGWLLMEVVALRDIQPGEEILMDYGIEWDEAWDHHVATTWTSTQDDDYERQSKASSSVGGSRNNNNNNNHKYAHDVNASYTRLWTEMEQQHDDSYIPMHLETSCYFHRDRSVAFVDDQEGYDNMMMTDTTSTTRHFQWQYHRDLFHVSRLRPCRILERRSRTKTTTYHFYKVAIGNRRGLSQADMIPKNERWLVYDMPREAIQFTNKPYTTDQFKPNAFRHAIGIPNDVFPTQWMDLVK